MANLVVVYEGPDEAFRETLARALRGLKNPSQVVSPEDSEMPTASLALVDHNVGNLEKVLSDYQVAGIPTVLVADGPGRALESLCDSGLTSGFVTGKGDDKLLAMGLCMIMSNLGIEVPVAEE